MATKKLKKQSGRPGLSEDKIQRAILGALLVALLVVGLFFVFQTRDSSVKEVGEPEVILENGSSAANEEQRGE